MERKNKIVSYRTCIYSNNQFKKDELIRLVKLNGNITIDLKQNIQGRGWWIKLCDQMFDDPKLIQILSKRLRCSIDQDLIRKLNDLWKKIK